MRDATADAQVVDSIGAAETLGLPVLAQIVERAPVGMFVCDVERRLRYVNGAACDIAGRSAQELLGRDCTDFVIESERAAARRSFAELSTSTSDHEPLTRKVVGPGGSEREVVFAPLRFDAAGEALAAAVYRDVTETRAAARAATASAQSAAAAHGTDSLNAILAGKARSAVEGTRAFWSGLAVVGADGGIAFTAAYGPDGADFGESSQVSQTLRKAPGEQFIRAMMSSRVQVGGKTSRAVVVLRTMWERDPVGSVYGSRVLDFDWEIGVCVPFPMEHGVNGVLLILLPVGSTTASDSEVAFCSVLADHAAVAVINERLTRHAARSAELKERRRVARDLHDSVSQALFAIAMHARAAQRVMERAELDETTALSRSTNHMAHLARGTLAEMRAMIFELRPDALAEEGLIGALRTQAAAISAREHVTVGVEAPVSRIEIAAEVEASLYRVASEALRNVVSHARADKATVSVTTTARTLTIVIADNGIGFDTTDVRARPGGLGGLGGLGEMARLARRVGAELMIRSGTGTTVSLEVDVERSADAVADRS